MSFRIYTKFTTRTTPRQPYQPSIHLHPSKNILLRSRPPVYMLIKSAEEWFVGRNSDLAPIRIHWGRYCFWLLLQEFVYNFGMECTEYDAYFDCLYDELFERFLICQKTNRRPFLYESVLIQIAIWFISLT